MSRRKEDRLMADKTKTIKNATDKELDELLVRLRKENETQNLIRELQIKSAPNSNSQYPDYTPYQGVSTEAPIENLYHFGIPGMHWGVRRQPGSSGRVSKGKVSKEVSDDYAQAKSIKAKNYKQMSNKELKDLTSRMQLERSLRDLKSSEYQKGLDFVKTATAMATTLATAYAISQTPLAKDIGATISRKLKG